jgi:hypothetical protein
VLDFWNAPKFPSGNSFPWPASTKLWLCNALVGWNRDTKGSEEGVMHLKVHLASLPPRRGVRSRGVDGGLGELLPGRSYLGDVPPPSLEGPTFLQVLMKLFEDFGFAVSFS